MAEKPKITLIGTSLAKPGLEFVYEGELADCTGCKIRKACNNLQKGRRYRIVGVRSGSKHECQVHAGGACAVDVIESPIVVLIGADMAILNSTINYTSSCNRTDCRSYDLCRPDGILEGGKYIVNEVLGNPPDHCERGRILKLVELRTA